MLAPVYIAVGSNQGNRLLELHSAFHFLREINDGQAPMTSAIYESAPVGPSSQPYLNAVCKLMRCTFSPFKLLEELKSFELKRGRSLTAAKWTQRPIDLDILYMGELVVQSEVLNIPHKRIEERNFVLVPLLSFGDSSYGYTKRESLIRILSSLPFNALQRTHLAWPSEN